MKLVVTLCVFVFVALSSSMPQERSRGCIYSLGKCVRECEEGTHAYSVGCGRKIPEATCEEPNPVRERVRRCDFSACYCDSPTVRDTVSGKCVPLDECPKKND